MPQYVIGYLNALRNPDKIRYLDVELEDALSIAERIDI